MNKTILIILSISIMLSSCSGINSDKKIMPKERLYAAAIKDLDRNRYKEATEKLQDLILLYPFTESAETASIMLGYAYYKHKDYTDAVAHLNNHLNRTPNGSNEDYIRYLIAVSEYQLMIIRNKDLEQIKQTHKSAETLIKKFPTSPYAKDIKRYTIAANELAAIRTFDIGYFYYHQRNNYEAAINRFQAILNQYGTSETASKTLYYIMTSYKALGDYQGMSEIYQKYINTVANNKWRDRSQKIMEEAINTQYN